MCGDCCSSEHGRKGHGHHDSGHHKHGKTDGCCCCGGHQRWRKFRTKEEIREELESYKEELEKEIQAVEERLKDLK